MEIQQILEKLTDNKLQAVKSYRCCWSKWALSFCLRLCRSYLISLADSSGTYHHNNEKIRGSKTWFTQPTPVPVRLIGSLSNFLSLIHGWMFFLYKSAACTVQHNEAEDVSHIFETLRCQALISSPGQENNPKRHFLQAWYDPILLPPFR